MKIDLKSISEVFSDVEFFIAGIGPCPTLEIDQVPETLAITKQPGFWAVTSKSPAHGRGLVHEIDSVQLLFRGYDGALGVHSYSDPARLQQLTNPSLLTNGVFAYICHDSRTGVATVKSDPFGIAPLFYRTQGGCHYFASHPGLIHFAEDEVDILSWASMLQNGQMLADRSFYQNIARFPAGTVMAVEPAGLRQQRWFRFEDLPDGSKAIDDQAFKVVEDAYRNAMERCLSLDRQSLTLPFSSGYDSRRFFAFLHERQIPFEAVTCQTFHRKKGRDYDIDSYFAPKIAAAFGVRCELVPAGKPEEIAADAARCQTLIGTETFMHAWAVPFMRWLARRPPSVLLDGLGGDTFGNSGFEIKGLHERPEQDDELVIGEVVKPQILRQLSPCLPDSKQFTEAYRTFLGQFAPNLNRAELAFLQSRTRRCISPWITMMHSPGHVVVFPYCDVEFARATLLYHPGEKYKWFFQKECLKRFYPDYFDFFGSRNLPADHPPLSLAESHERERILQHFTYGSLSTILFALRYLRFSGKLLLLLSLLWPELRSRRDWLFRPLLLLTRTLREGKVFLNPINAAGHMPTTATSHYVEQLKEKT